MWALAPPLGREALAFLGLHTRLWKQRGHDSPVRRLGACEEAQGMEAGRGRSSLRGPCVLETSGQSSRKGKACAGIRSWGGTQAHQVSDGLKPRAGEFALRLS